MPRAHPLCPARLVATLWLCVLAGSAQAEQIWSARLLGVKVGTLTLDWGDSKGVYQAKARFRTSGVAGVLAQVRFDLSSQGVLHPRVSPTQYSEDIHTGRRQSAAQVTFEDGQPKTITGRLSQGGTPLPSKLNDPLDPVSALMLALRDPVDRPTCTLNRFVFDGARLTQIDLSQPQDDRLKVTCAGSYHRVAGYHPDELAEATSFPTVVTYQVQSGAWRTQRVKLKSLYGTVTLVRRD